MEHLASASGSSDATWKQFCIQSSTLLCQKLTASGIMHWQEYNSGNVVTVGSSFG